MSKVIAKVEIGRSGFVGFLDDGTAHLEIEVKRDQSAPTVNRFTGYAKTCTVTPYECSRTGSGNGMDRYEINDHGIYVVEGAHHTGNRRVDQAFRYSQDGVFSLSRQELDAELREDFPASANDFDREQERRNRNEEERKRMEQQIMGERDEYKDVVSDDGYTARPEFRMIPDNIATRAEPEEELVVIYGTPYAYVVEKPCFARAETAEEAIEQARNIHQQRVKERDDAKSLKKKNGWPTLAGSRKQVQWAEQIRKRYFDSVGANNSVLKERKEAKFWIDNYKHLTRS